MCLRTTPMGFAHFRGRDAFGKPCENTEFFGQQYGCSASVNEFIEQLPHFLIESFSGNTR